MAYEIVLKVLEPQPTLAIRTTTTPQELAGVLSQVYAAVAAHARKTGARVSGQPFTRYHGFDETKIDLEAGLPVAAPAEGGGEIVAGELPGGPVAMTVHVGPYSRLAEAHVALATWLQKHGKQPAGNPWEVYLSDPSESAPEEWRTQVVYPLQEAQG